MSPSCAGSTDNHFTFLGHRSYDLDRVQGEDVLRIVHGSSLGILRDIPGKEVAASFSALPPEVRAYARRPELLVVTKATARSTVHRPGYLDYIGVKRFDAQGQVCGEHRFLGLFTSMAYRASAADIPLLRRKITNVVARAKLPAGSHADKMLVNVLETYPRDELFQMAGRRTAAHGRGDPASRRPPAIPAVRPPRCVRALPVVPHLRAARELHDGAAAEVAGDSHRGLQWDELRFQRPPVRVEARANPDHGAHDAGKDSADRRPRSRGAPRRRRAALDR